MSHAIVIHETGDASSLRWEPHDPGEPGPGQVRVALRAAGVNFIDVYFRSGLYPRPVPFVAGLEGAGVVEAMGPSVEGLAVGDRVAWAAAPGSYAEAVNAHAGSLVKISEAVSFEVAAAVMLQGMTAHYLMNGCRTTAEGDVALVHAAAGGVGLLLIQLLKQAGATVIGTCGAAEKVELARKAGADHVIRYDELDFQAEVAAFTDGRGCDVVYDSVGQATFDGSLGCVRPRGLLALFGQSSGPVPPFDLQRLNAGGSQRCALRAVRSCGCASRAGRSRNDGQGDPASRLREGLLAAIDQDFEDAGLARTRECLGGAGEGKGFGNEGCNAHSALGQGVEGWSEGPAS